MLGLSSEEIMNMNISQLWNSFQVLMEEEGFEEENDKEIKIIKYGDLKVPIWYFTQKWYEEIPESRKVKIKGYGKYDINNFMEDKSRRETIMRTILYENVEDGGITEGRN